MATTTSSLPPCLVIASDDRKAATIVYNVSDGTHCPCEKIMSDNLGLGDGGKRMRSWVTSHGWVLVWDSTTLATFLWNPQDNEKNITLPPLSRPPPAGTSCALSSAPTNPNGFTVVILGPSKDTALWYCHYSGGGAGRSSEWARHENDLGGSWVPSFDLCAGENNKVWYKRSMTRLVPLSPRRGGMVAKFYCTLSPAKYAVLGFSSSSPPSMKPRPHEIAVPAPGETYSQACAYSLDIAGELHTVWVSIDASEAVLDVAIYRRSVRVGGIGDRANMAGGANSSFAGWCPASEHGLLPNSLYWVNPCDNRLYVYDVGANTEEEVIEPCKGVAGAAPPCWLIPPHA
ncbi:hypothetical protein BRADI_1g51589v3 [Brachypodium distachyon]|uniref:KIB1-4 beta-propeller domain-containing protein n=1 Tax=Brachypodium distachyon TaxID=15368 RepID=A0A0Q3L9Z0_BRADI|nr:hypothetical protein BRADI_1g51589v3 [Brachypodium distachyon]